MRRWLDQVPCCECIAVRRKGRVQRRADLLRELLRPADHSPPETDGKVDWTADLLPERRATLDGPHRGILLVGVVVAGEKAWAGRVRRAQGTRFEERVCARESYGANEDARLHTRTLRERAASPMQPESTSLVGDENPERSQRGRARRACVPSGGGGREFSHEFARAPPSLSLGQ